VFVVDSGRAKLVRVKLGESNAIEAEIAAGLNANQRVVLHPSGRVRDGVRVVSRDD
jgi:HlyD family secretion protein